MARPIDANAVNSIMLQHSALNIMLDLPPFPGTAYARRAPVPAPVRTVGGGGVDGGAVRPGSGASPTDAGKLHAMSDSATSVYPPGGPHHNRPA